MKRQLPVEMVDGRPGQGLNSTWAEESQTHQVVTQSILAISPLPEAWKGWQTQSTDGTKTVRDHCHCQSQSVLRLSVKYLTLSESI